MVTRHHLASQAFDSSSLSLNFKIESQNKVPENPDVTVMQSEDDESTICAVGRSCQSRYVYSVQSKHKTTRGGYTYVKIAKRHLKKLEDRNKKMVHFGVEKGTKAY